MCPLLAGSAALAGATTTATAVGVDAANTTVEATTGICKV